MKEADRFNNTKVDLSYLPTVACLEECKVWMFGAKKYTRDNWKKLWGDNTPFVAGASAMRHLLAICSGEMIDKESGLPHAAHVRCNMAMILEWMEREKLIDSETYKEKA